MAALSAKTPERRFTDLKKTAIRRDSGVRVFRVVGCGSRVCTSQLIRTKSLAAASTLPSPPKVQATATPNLHPTPSTLFDRDPATNPSNPDPASPRREPRSLNLETLSTIHGSRSVDHGPICLDLGPRTMVQGSGKVAGKVLTVDL
jgi:hypothetical protein